MPLVTTRLLFNKKLVALKSEPQIIGIITKKQNILTLFTPKEPKNSFKKSFFTQQTTKIATATKNIIHKIISGIKLPKKDLIVAKIANKNIKNIVNNGLKLTNLFNFFCILVFI